MSYAFIHNKASLYKQQGQPLYTTRLAFIYNKAGLHTQQG